MGNVMGAGGQAAIKEKQDQKGKWLGRTAKKNLGLVIAEMKTHPLVCGNDICRRRENHHRESAGETFYVGGKYKDTR